MQQRYLFPGCDPNALDRQVYCLRTIYAAFQRHDFVEAGIRIIQSGLRTYFTKIVELSGELIKAYDPSEPRDAQGRWTSSGGHSGISESLREAVVDPYCQIVKKLCIVEATEKLPTQDYGVSFFKTLNACMDRFGCLGRA